MNKLNLSITEQLAFSTVRIQCSDGLGNTSSGTGYFFNFCMDKDTKKHIPAIVTNKHVVSGAKNGHFVMTLQENGKPSFGNNIPITIEGFEDHWIKHPKRDIDLCVFPIAPLLSKMKKLNKKPFYIPLSDDILPTTDEVESLTAMEDIVMIGYPNGIWDSVNNQPVFRKGITATHPARDYENRQEFMIDAACFPGSSGSPVFLINLGGYQTRNGHVLGRSRIKLLGTLYAGPQYTAQGDIQIRTIPTQQKAISLIEIPNNLGFVIKSHVLNDFDDILKEKSSN